MGAALGAGSRAKSETQGDHDNGAKANILYDFACF